MYKYKDKIVDVQIKKSEEKIIDLGLSLPLGTIIGGEKVSIEISLENKKFTPIKVVKSFNNVHAQYLKVLALEDVELVIKVGVGYYAIKNKEFEKHFIRKSGWSGADGIFSFNLENNEDYNQEKDLTMFVFGDTFVGDSSDNDRRIEPTAMVNNTIAYYKNKKMDFIFNRDKKGSICSIFEIDKRILETGYAIRNVVDYSTADFIKPFASSFNPNEDIEIVFDLNGFNDLSKIEIENYHDEPSFGLEDNLRGLNKIYLSYATSNSFVELGEYTLNKYSKENKVNTINCNIEARFIKLVIKHDNGFNHGGLTKEDKIVGFNKIKFYDVGNNLLQDVNVTTNSSFNLQYKKAWFWFQDGLLLNDEFYTYPLIVEEELNGIEGYEFKISGTCEVRVVIKNNKLDFKSAQMRRIPFYDSFTDKEFILPAAILNNINDDGYIYYYGYYNVKKMFDRRLIVGRIRGNDFPNYNKMEFYNGSQFVNDIHQAKGLLQHVSCEMSVQKIKTGLNKNKYLVVFQYDTNSPYVAYSIGESLLGPFSEPRLVYYTPEVDEFYKGSTYTYNAKSHLHLSKENNILVSYNVNDMVMAHNKEQFKIYHPRFINLIDTTGNDDEI